MEVRIEKIKHGDILEIKRLLEGSTSIVANNVTREILQHIKDGIALKMVTDDKITGIWCSIEMEEYTSLSYFYIDSSMRRTMWVLDLFICAGTLISKTKPVLIASKDTTGFDRYVEKIGENLYRFKGLR